MPVISKFYRITIIMYFNDHDPPHCHAKYSGKEAIFDFDGNLLEGELPPRAAGFVREWISQHKLELAANWAMARSGQPLDLIAPLECIMLHIKSVKYISGFRIWVASDDGTEGQVDLKGQLQGPVVEPLKDKGFFSKAAVDPELETIVSPNGADLAPEFVKELQKNQSNRHACS